MTENPPVQIYVNKIKNKIVFKIKTGYKLDLLTHETMKLLGSTKKNVDQNKNGENLPKLEIVEVVLVHCKLVKNIQIINTHQKFYSLCSKQTVWTVNKYFTTFFNNDGHN